MSTLNNIRYRVSKYINKCCRNVWFISLTFGVRTESSCKILILLIASLIQTLSSIDSQAIDRVVRHTTVRGARTVTSGSAHLNLVMRGAKNDAVCLGARRSCVEPTEFAHDRLALRHSLDNM